MSSPRTTLKFVVARPRVMDKLEKTILHKLLRHCLVGGKHTAIENIPRGFLKHLHKELMKTAEKLIKKGLIVPKPTGYGVQISLNPRKLVEIEAVIRDP